MVSSLYVCLCAAWMIQRVVAVPDYVPKAYAVGSTPTIDGLKTYTKDAVTLDESSPVLTLDYGTLAGGFPYIEVECPDGAAQVELKYSEPYDGLEMPYADGPWLYIEGLMNSFRQETFNVTKAGRTESFFLQGSLRWQTIRLVSGSGVIIRGAGIRPSVSIKPPSSLPGAFSTSKSGYGDVWDLGARAVQAACVDAHSQPSTWEVSNDGALVRGQYPAVSAKGDGFANYTLEFTTKITSGGTGWRIAGGSNGGYGAYFVLTSSGPALESYNITSLPRNSLVAGYGYSIINQAILPSAPPRTFDVAMTIDEGKWYTIATSMNETGYVVSVDGKQIGFVSIAEYESYVNTGWGTDSVFAGTFGFGPYLNQEAWFKDVRVTAQNGSVVYENPLTSDEVYEEYTVAENPVAVCLDGAKRDREIWIGDFAHTARIISVSSGRYDFISSMIEFEFDWQLSDGDGDGLVPIQAYMGAGKQYRDVYYPSEFGETDYQTFFMLTLGDYYALTGDADLLRKNWGGINTLVQTFTERYLDANSGLLASPDASWFTAQGQQNATAPTALFVVALQQLVRVASALGEHETVSSWEKLSADMGSAINTQLWNDTMGAYSLSLQASDVSSILATAFTIRAGIADHERAVRSVEQLSDVLLKIGYKDNSAADDSAGTQLSPNTQGFLFESLFLAHLQLGVPASTVLPAIQTLAEVFWPKMATQNEYYTGASWEYLYQDGSPGIGIFTSLSHPWGGAATYVFSNYILGIRSEWNSGLGKYQWVFDPAWEVAEGLGLQWAKGRVPLSTGGYIEAEWDMSGAASKDSKPVMSAKVVGNKQVKVITKSMG